MSISWITVCPLVLCLGLRIEGKPSDRQSTGNAKDVDIKKFPWQATIINSEEKPGSPCGGAIISKRYLVTAALCTPYDSIDKLHVTVGSSIFEKGIKYNVKLIHNHPNFTTDFPYPHDIAVIKLDGEIVFDETKNAIALPDNDVPSGAKVTVTGWGNEPYGTFSEHLTKQNLTIAERKICDTVIAENDDTDVERPADSSKLCGMPESDAIPCQSNIGIGVVYEKTLVGVNAGPFTCEDGSPEIITSVYEHVRWIREVIGN